MFNRMKNKIFISYRREGGDVVAKLICEALKNKGYDVFFDYDSLKGGTFDNRLLDAIDSCSDVVLVLPKNALVRCKNEDDWVRREIKYALEKKKNIIPVMMEKFEFPKKLPKDIQDLSRYNGVRFHMDFFDTVIEKIVEKLVPEDILTVVDSSSNEQCQCGFTTNVKKRIYLNIDQKRAQTADIFIYSPESTKNNILKYDFSEKEWQVFVDIIKNVVSVLLHTSNNMISVANRDPLGVKSCSPCDGWHYDEQSHIVYSVNYLSNYTPNNFDSLHLTIDTIDNNVVKLNLFQKGNYVFHYVSEQTDLSYFGIDEVMLIEAIKPLVFFAENNHQLIFADHFDTVVYSDKSGGFYLKYLSTN